MKNGFIKVCAATPKIRVADPSYNVTEMLRIAQEANHAEVRVLVFPELCITGATCGDLFFSETLIAGALEALERFVDETRDCNMVSVVGLPLAVGSALYNCAAICHGGRVLGFVPKSHASAELADGRYFSFESPNAIKTCANESVFVTREQLFTCSDLPALRIAVEIGSDLAVIQPTPPNYAGQARR